MARWLIVLAALLAAEARAETYPAKPVQVIVQFNPGATSDIIGRVLADDLSQRLGQQFIVVNREGAAGVVGNTAAAQARPDGYTLLFAVAGSLTAQPHLVRDIPYTIDSFAPICQVFETQFIAIVAPKSAYASLADLVQAARSNPGRLTYGVFGVGSVPHLQFHSLLIAAKVAMTSVPYRSIAQLVSDTSSRQIDVGVTSFGSLGAAPVRILVGLGSARNESYPDIPSTAELGYPVSDPNFTGLLAPKGTPPDILKSLETGCAAAMQTPRMRDILKRTGSPAASLGAAAYAAHLRADFAAKGALIRAMNLKSE